MAIVFTYQPPPVDAGVVVHAMVEGAEMAGANVLLRVSQPLVPVDLGDLKGSGRVEHDGRSAAVIYDAESPEGYPYGIRQHEDESLHHPNGGQAHYLSDPMVTARTAVLTAMAAAVRF